jgi:hypothetical protein
LSTVVSTAAVIVEVTAIADAGIEIGGALLDRFQD